MAVYTTLSCAQVSAYLSPFKLGELIDLRGISGGIDSCTLGRLAQLAVNELNEEKHENYQ